MVTLRDVARRALVSTATVSRVLSGGYYVRDETRKKVLEAVKEMKYRPNAVARSLRNARTNTIGVVVPDISNPYFMRLARSLEDVMTEQGYNMLLASSDDDSRKEETLLSIFFDKRVDAVVLAPSELSMADVVTGFVERSVPIVLIDRVANGTFDSVSEENESSTYELIRYLITMGHRDIAIINSGALISTVMARESGFQRAMEDHGVSVNPLYVLRGQYDQRTGYMMTRRLLSLDTRPTALFCTNNSIAVGAMIACRELGVSIPDDLSIVSFGDLLLPELISPRLTAVIQNPDEVGSATARILLDRLTEENGAIGQSIVLPTHVRLGDSVKSLVKDQLSAQRRLADAD